MDDALRTLVEDGALVRFTVEAGFFTMGERWLAWLTSSLTRSPLSITLRCVLRVSTDLEAAEGAAATDLGAMTLF